MSENANSGPDRLARLVGRFTELRHRLARLGRTVGLTTLVLGWLCLGGAWLARAALQIPLGWLSFVYYLPGLFFVPVAGLVALLHGHFYPRRRTWAATGALAVAVGPLMGLTLSITRPSNSESRVTIVTANVQSYTADLDAVGEALAAAKPDVVLLQEVWTIRHLNVLKRHLPGFHFIQAGGFINGDYLKLGVFIGTRLQLQNKETLDHALLVDLESKLGPLRVVALHGRKRFGFTPDDVAITIEMQIRQTTRILEALGGVHTFVVAGDFNAPPTTPGLKLLRARAKDSFAESGNGYGLTFPTRLPMLRIDQILHGPGLQALSCATFRTGSDHLAVKVELGAFP